MRDVAASEKSRFLSPGMAYMFVSAFFFSIMGLLVRLLRTVPFMEIVVVRSVVSVAIAAFMLRWARKRFGGPHKGLLLLRGLFGFFGLSCYFFTIEHMPLAEAVVIQYTNPLFTALLAPLILKEKGGGREWIAGLIAFAGVAVIAQPTSLHGAIPAAVGLFGAMCAGTAYNIVRKLGMQGEDPLRIVMFFPLVAVALGSPVAAVTWMTPSLLQLALLLGVGVTTLIAQVALTNGLRAERAARATVMNYLVIALSTVYSVALGERLTAYTFIGMACIVSAIVLVNLGAMRKMNAGRKRRAEQ